MKTPKVTVEMYKRKRVRVLKDITWTNAGGPRRTLPAGWEGEITRLRPDSASAMLENGSEFCVCEKFLLDGSLQEI